MSLYQQAAASGMSSVALAISGSNAETEAAKASAYNAQAQRLLSAGAKSAAEKNISAIAQDKIISNVNVRLQQSQAEAMQTLNAAFAGASGGSVADSVYVIKSGAENLVAANNQKAEQATDQQLAQVNKAHAATVSVRDQRISTSDAIMRGLSSFEFSDIKMTRDISEQGISKLWSD